MALGCAVDPVGRQGSKIAVVDSYERDYSWTDPVPCELFLHRRVIDEEARFVEYDARIDGMEISAIYSIDAKAARPVIVEVYRGSPGSAQQSLHVEAAGHDLEVISDAGLMMVVSGYDGPSDSTTIQPRSVIDDREGLTLLACALPVRTELGPVPQFLLNRSSGGRDPENPDVSQSSSNEAPILNWTGAVSIAGAYLLEGACLLHGSQEKAGWDCPCLTGFESIAGPVNGWCGASPAMQ
jgi:hypothetical protein